MVCESICRAGSHQQGILEAVAGASKMLREPGYISEWSKERVPSSLAPMRDCAGDTGGGRS